MGTSRTLWFNPFRHQNAQSAISSQNDQNALSQLRVYQRSKLVKTRIGRVATWGRQKRGCNRARCHYVNKKWLGVMLTNWYTTETILHKSRDLRTEQKMGRLNRLPKRNSTMLKRQLSHLQTYLSRIKYMIGLPDTKAQGKTRHRLA